MAEFVRLEVADGVGTIRLDRPKMNALSIQVQQEIRRGGGRGLRARRRPGRGPLRRRADLRGRRRRQGDGGHVARRHGRRVGGLQAGSRAVAQIPKPVVAAVTGYALGGGCELALCADFRFAADDATLGQPEALLGPDPGRGRHPAADPPGRSQPGQGPDLHRPVGQGRRGAGHRPGRPGGPGRRGVRRRRVAWAGQFAGAASVALRRPRRPSTGLDGDLDRGLELEARRSRHSSPPRTARSACVVRRERAGQGEVRRPLTGRVSGPCPRRACLVDNAGGRDNDCCGERHGPRSPGSRGSRWPSVCGSIRGANLLARLCPW